MKPTSEDVAKWIRESPTTYEIPSFIAGQAYKAGTAAQLERLLGGVEMPEPYAHLCLLQTKDAGPTKFFTAPSDPRGFAVYTADQLRSTVAAAVAKKDAYAIACQTETDALRAENERLRAALKDAVEFTREWGYFDVAKAEAALKGQP